MWNLSSKLISLVIARSSLKTWVRTPSWYLACSGQRKPKRFKLQDDFWCEAAHVMDHPLVVKPIGSLNSAACVAPPVILGHVSRSAVDTALRGACVRPSGEHFGTACRFHQPVAHKTSCCPWNSTTCANHNFVLTMVMDLSTCDLSRRINS